MVRGMHAWHRFASKSVYPFESLFVRRKVYRFLSNFSKLSPCSGFRARHRMHHHPCLPPASCGTPLPPPLDPFNRNSLPPIFPPPPTPAEFLWKLSDIHICPLLHQKFQARPAQPARVLSLSYKGFAATYNISSSPLFPCHFALLRHPPSPIYPLTLLASLRSFSFLLLSVPLNVSHSLLVRCHRRLNSPSAFVFHSTSPFSSHSLFTPQLCSFFRCFPDDLD